MVDDDAVATGGHLATKRWTGIWSHMQIAANVVETFGKFAIVVTVVLWMWERPQREQASIYQAWQVVNLATGQHGSGGRIEALEDLNRKHVDLSNVSLANANLTGIKFQSALLSGADFRGAILTHADFRESDITFGKFLGQRAIDNVRFDGARLWQSDFSNSAIQSSSFTLSDKSVALGPSRSSFPDDERSAVLDYATFKGSSISDSNFVSASFQGADFSETQFDYDNFSRTQGMGASFNCSWVSGVYFNEADLSGADFEGARIVYATFNGTNLEGVRFDKARLKNVQFEGARHFDASSLKKAKYLLNVRINGKRVPDIGTQRDFFKPLCRIQQ